MVDDEMMDEWLREAMAGETPRLSPRSDDKLIARLRPRRLTTQNASLLPSMPSAHLHCRPGR